jgi:hypothetical protein
MNPDAPVTVMFIAPSSSYLNSRNRYRSSAACHRTIAANGDIDSPLPSTSIVSVNFPCGNIFDLAGYGREVRQVFDNDRAVPQKL